MKINVIDVESTCWDYNSGLISEIIQIGISQVNFQTGEITPPRSIIIKPTQSEKLSKFCTGLTGLTDEVVFGTGVSFQEATDIIRKEFKSSNLSWGSWGDYDRQMFVADSQRNNVQYPLSKQHLNIKLMYSVLTGQQRLGMDKALSQLGIVLEGRHHDGADDAYNTAKILLQMKGRYNAR